MQWHDSCNVKYNYIESLEVTILGAFNDVHLKLIRLILRQVFNVPYLEYSVKARNRLKVKFQTRGGYVDMAFSNIQYSGI